ncbi:hypothetical protein FQ082_02450 [Psychrobacter sp. ANT_H56B]|jgi:hypothetical protein|uniref:hypothetical protein n=1 Tax=unclassified Psychrobacter TaxID=196806 RepID=UPI000354EBCF|nr:MULTISPECIES: hypothetical protein [unclassified Psychrobacter]AGP49284.1 hypothetical protein PSYCG_08885 [Psychrobacter sp. G]KAA0929604.1 hypothetical protein FQ082_02450 [Psychrobacter sp. ANT_H56B]
MTDLNKSNNTDHTNSANEQPLNEVDNNVNSQQVSIKAWSQKLLVVILCIASFYGGWKSYESNMVNECTANGGQMIEGKKTMICQLS